MTREEIDKLASDYLNDRESTLDMERLFEFALESLQRCQEIDNKFANATNTDWVRKGYTDAEVKDICDDARKALQTQLKESQEIFNKDSATESMLNADLISRQTDPCEDIISRQAALDTFGLSDKTRKYGGDHSGYDTIMLYEVQDALEALPSVTPTQKSDSNALNALDCVDRQAVLDIIHHYKNDRDSQLSDLTDGVCNLPSVQPEQKWIPVSEMLPKEFEEVLVTFKSDDEIRVYNCKYFDNSPWWKNYVIAWMPLPEPFKAESEG